MCVSSVCCLEYCFSSRTIQPLTPSYMLESGFKVDRFSGKRSSPVARTAAVRDRVPCSPSQGERLHVVVVLQYVMVRFVCWCSKGFSFNPTLKNVVCV